MPDGSAPGIDPAFLALPMRRLADAALGRAQGSARARRLPAGADRTQALALRDGKLDSARDGETSASPFGSCTTGRGVSPASTSPRRPWCGSPSRPSRWPGQPYPVNSGADRAGRRASLPGRHLGLGVRGGYFAVPDEDKIGLLTDWSERLLAADGVDHVEAAVQQVLENKFYADLAGTAGTTQQRVRLHPEGDRDRRRPVPRHVRVDADLRAAGRPRLGNTSRRHLGLGRRAGRHPGGWPRRRRRRPLTRGNTTWSSTRPISGSPSTSRLDARPSWTALGYEAAYAGTSFATFDKLGTLPLAPT